MPAITVRSLTRLYLTYEEDLRTARREQYCLLRDRQPSMKAKLDDVEAEITYLLLRERRPDTVVEIGAGHGWSTTWILRALRDNDHGTLHSFGTVDHVVRNVPPELPAGRWVFTRGDVRRELASIPAGTGYLFIDADHGVRFARWYLTNLFPIVAPGTPTSVHDVFHGRRPRPFSEGSVLLRWLNAHRVVHFTPSPARDLSTFAALMAVRKECGMDARVHGRRANPMVFFDLPDRPA